MERKREDPPLLWRMTSAVAARARSERVLSWLERAQKARTRVEEVQSATLHFLALPTRQDVRRLERRLRTIRERVVEIEAQIAHLERAEQLTAASSTRSGRCGCGEGEASRR